MAIICFPYALKAIFPQNLIISIGYTTTSIQLYWEKPLLYFAMGKDEYGNPKYLKLSLEGYRYTISFIIIH